MHTALHQRFEDPSELKHLTKYDTNSTRRHKEIEILRNSHNDTMAYVTYLGLTDEE